MAVESTKAKSRRLASLLALLVLLGLAAALRVPGFDRPPQLSLGSLYQDEYKMLSNTLKVLKGRSLLPHWPYGIYRIMAVELGALWYVESIRHGRSWWDPFPPYNFRGIIHSDLNRAFRLIRANAMVFGLGIVWLTWLVGRRICGDVGGLAAGLIVAIAPLMVSYSRMMYYDIAMVFFFVLYLLVFAKAVRERSVVHVYLAFIVSAVAFTMKQNAAVLALPDAFLLMHVIAGWRIGALLRSRHTYWTVAAAVVCVWFGYPTLFTPDGLRGFLDSLGSQYYGKATREVSHLWWTWFSVFWADQGPPILMLFLAAGLVAGARAGDDRVLATSVLSIGAVYYLIGGYSTHSNERTLMPLVPVLALGLAGWVAWLRVRARTTIRAGVLVVVLVFACVPLLQNTVRANLLVTMADTRVQMLDWMIANARDGSLVVREMYAPHLPQPIPARYQPEGASRRGKSFETISQPSLVNQPPTWYLERGVRFLLHFPANIDRLHRQREEGFEISPTDLSARRMGKQPRYGIPIPEALARYDRLHELYPAVARFDPSPPPEALERSRVRLNGFDAADFVRFLFQNWYDPGVLALWRNQDSYTLGPVAVIYQVDS